MGDPLGLFTQDSTRRKQQSAENDPLGLFSSQGAPEDFSDVRSGSSTAPAPRRGIVTGIASAIGDLFPSTNEPRRMIPPVDRRTPEQKAADDLAERRALQTQRPDVTGTGGFQTPATVATHEKNVAAMKTRGVQRAQFSPEKWQQIAAAGAEYANQLHAQGRHEEAEDINRKSYNAQLLASGAKEADTHGAIVLSNLLGIIHDPYAGQRRNIAEAEMPGMVATPEEQTAMGVAKPAYPARPFSIGKDIVAPLAGQAPVLIAGGAAGRTAGAVIGAGLERAGAETIGTAIGRLARGVEVPEMLGPRVPVSSMRNLGLRVGEEARAFRAALPSMMGRGATEGQIIMGTQQYRMAREQGATVEDAVKAALEGAALNVPFGAAAEIGLGVVGRAAGVGFDPVGRLASRIRQHIAGRPEPELGLDVAGEADVPPAGPAPETLHRTIGEGLDQLLAQRQIEERGTSAVERPPSRVRTRAPEEPVPLRTAAEIAMERTRPAEEANAVTQMERQRRFAEAARVQAEQMANEPDLQLELAAQQRPGEVQGPKTLGETLAQAGEERAAGEPLATEYHDAINNYVDALAAVKDRPKDSPPTMKQQVALARARQALNDARQRYGAQVGASAVLALAASNDDLTDDEKKLVGLGALAIGSLRIVKEIPAETRVRLRDHIARNFPYAETPHDWVQIAKDTGFDLGGHEGEQQFFRALQDQMHPETDKVSPEQVQRILADLPGEQRPPGTQPIPGKFVSRLRQAIEALPGKAWDQPRPAADWIGKLKGLSTFSKKELELMLPQLEDAAARKQKLARDDVMALADATLPKIERVTLGGPPEAAAAPEPPTAPAGRIHDIDDVFEQARDERDRPYLDEQLSLRQERIRELEQDVEHDQQRAYEDMEEASGRQSEKLHDLYRLVEDAGLTRDVLDPALQYIGEYGESADSDAAFQKIWEDLSTSRDPEEVLREEGYRIEEVPAAEPDHYYSFTHIGPRGESKQSRFYHVSGETQEHIRERVAEDYGAEAARTLEFSEKPGDPTYRVLGPDGRVVAEDLSSREDAASEAVNNEALDDSDNELHENVQYALSRYIDATAVYQEAESRHYSLTEEPEYALSHIYEEIEKLRDETGRIDRARDTLPDAPEEEPEPLALPETTEAPAVDPYALPVEPTPKGRAEFSGFQRLGGGKNYRELLNVLENPPEESYEGGHYSKRAGYVMDPRPNLAGHVRAEDHLVYETPGLTGEQVEIDPNDSAVVKAAKQVIADTRVERNENYRQLGEIVRKLEAMPASETDPNNPSPEAARLASDYRSIVTDITGLSHREEVNADKLRSAWELKHGREVPSRTIATMLESQSDWAQEANEFGIRRPVAETEEALRPLREAAQRAMEQTDRAVDAEAKAKDRFTDARQTLADLADAEYPKLQNEWAEMERTGRATAYGPPSWRRILDPDDAPDFELLRTMRPEWGSALDELKAAAEHANETQIAAQSAYDEQVRTRGEVDRAERAAKKSVPPSPLLETRAAFSLNAARFLLDAAERGHDHIAWSDAANRVKVASLPIKAAKLVYDDITKSAVVRMLGNLGFKNVPVDRVFIQGYGHWHVELTPAMRSAIRKAGLPILSAMAMTGLSAEEAKAQGTEGAPASRSLYGTLAGGLVAGAALATLLTSKRMRRLVKENRELGTAIMRDDLSGLANKRAFTEARSVIDADPSMAWAAFDAAQFKRVNDVAGHDAGDKAIQRFGHAIAAAAKETGVDLRAFRPGGDEFAVAVPKERAQEFIDAVEKHSKHTVSGIETQLHGMAADTYEQADQLLNQRKDDLRSLGLLQERRASRYHGATEAEVAGQEATNAEFDAALSKLKAQEPPATAEEAKIVSDAIAKAELPKDLPPGLLLHANPIGPALRQLSRYPAAAALMGVGAVMGESDNENIKRASKPTIALGALSMIGSHRLKAAKDVFGGGVLNLLTRTEAGKRMVEFFNPGALLSPEAKQALEQYRQTQAYGRSVALEHGRAAERLGPAGNRAVSDVIENEQWEDPNQFTPQQMQDVLTVAAGIEREVRKLTDAKVQHGVLEPTQAIPGYLKRKYAQFDALDAVADHRAGGVTQGKTIGAATKSRVLDEPIRAAEVELADARASGDPARVKDAEDALTEAQLVQQQQRVTLGEIREAGYRASATFDQGWHDVAAAKLHEQLRAQPGTVHPGYDSELSNFLAARSLYKAAKTTADRDAAKALMDDSFVKLKELSDRFKAKGGEWRTLPDTRSYGVLRGMPVTRAVYNEIAPAFDPGKWDQFLNFWKQAKTIFNVGTSVGNVASNVAFAHMEGMHLFEQPLWLKRALSDLKAYGPATRHLSETGVLEASATFSPNEVRNPRAQRSEEGLGELLQTTRPETQRVLRERGITEQSVAARKRRGTATRAAVGAAVGAGLLADNENPEDAALGATLGGLAGAALNPRVRAFIRRGYANEDNLFRIALYMKQVAEGMPKDAAAVNAKRALGDMAAPQSPATQMIRRTVSPFFLYPLRAVPRFASQMIDHPWRYATLMGAFAALDLYARKQVGPVEERDIAPQDRRDNFGYFLPGFTQLPFMNERGEKANADMARWTPLSSMTSSAPPGTTGGAISDQFPAFLQPSGPLLDIGARAVANADPFSGKPVVKKDYPLGENIAGLLHQAAEVAAPSMLAFHRERLQTDINNRDWDKFKNDVLGPTGMRPRFTRPGAQVQRAVYQLEDDLTAMKREFNQAMIANKNPEHAKEIVDTYLHRVSSALSHFSDRMGPPPADVVRRAMDTQVTPP